MIIAQQDFKSTVANKYLSLQLNGLVTYSLYLDQQLTLCEMHDYSNAYRKYIEKQISNTEKKIQNLKVKLGQ